MKVESHKRGVTPVQAPLPVSFPAVVDRNREGRHLPDGDSRQSSAKPRRSADRGTARENDGGNSVAGSQIDLKV